MSQSKTDERWDQIGDNPLVIMSNLQQEVDWLKEANDFILEEEFEKGTNAVAAIIAANGNVPQPAVATLCVKLQALSVVYRMRYVAYMSYKKGTLEANMKKNHYKELYTGLDRLVDSLKYLVRQ